MCVYDFRKMYRLEQEASGENCSGVEFTSDKTFCKEFALHLYKTPSDRHAYQLKYHSSPVLFKQLPPLMRDFYKFVKKQKFNLLCSDHGLVLFSHYYGTSGRKTQKITTYNMLFDLEFLAALSEQSFIECLQARLREYVNVCNGGAGAGAGGVIDAQVKENNTFGVVKSLKVATFLTNDPNIKIQVLLKSYDETELGFLPFERDCQALITLDDISLIIKYMFLDTHTIYEELPKRKKYSDSKLMHILHCSEIKLPANNFLSYLTKYCVPFYKNCVNL